MSNVANITIDHTKVDADLTDFPIYIDLSDLPDSFWDVVANGGGDIRVYKDDGTTELAREIVSCDTGTKTGEMHLDYDGTLSSSSDITIQIWADGSSSEPASDATYGSENVWGDYEAVSHMNETSGSMVDSTGNGHTGTYQGDLPNTTTGKLSADAQDLDGVGDYVDVTDGGDFDFANGTMQIWVNSQETSEAGQHIFGDRDSNNSNYIQLYSYDPFENTGLLQIRINDGSSSHDMSTSEGSWEDNVWGMAHITWGNSGMEAFLNGSSECTDAYTGNWTSNGDFDIGRTQKFSDASFNGYLQEFRVRDEQLTATWISTEYNNQSSPSTFYTASEPSPATNTTNFFQFF